MIEGQSWEEFYNVERGEMSPRLLYHIDNLDLLHKSKEESQIDMLQQKARSDDDAMNAWADDQISEDENIDENGDHDNDGDGIQADADSIVEEIISSSSTMSGDWYVLEAADANLDAGYLTSQSDQRSALNTFHYCSISLKEMTQSIEMLKLQMTELAKKQVNEQCAWQPSVFLTSGAEIEAAIQEVVQKFTLNREQTRAFHIVAKHSLGQSKVGTQLLMGIFGEGGTGKSRVIDAIGLI